MSTTISKKPSKKDPIDEYPSMKMKPLWERIFDGRNHIDYALVIESPVLTKNEFELWAHYPKIFRHTDGHLYVFNGCHSVRGEVYYKQVLPGEVAHYCGSVAYAKK
jgi:hypothetical protein